MIPEVATAHDFAAAAAVLITAVYFNVWALIFDLLICLLHVSANLWSLQGKWLNTFSKKAAQSKTFHGLVGNRNVRKNYLFSVRFLHFLNGISKYLLKNIQEQFMCASARFTDYSLSKDLMVVSLDYQVQYIVFLWFYAVTRNKFPRTPPTLFCLWCRLMIMQCGRKIWVENLWRW